MAQYEMMQGMMNGNAGSGMLVLWILSIAVGSFIFSLIFWWVHGWVGKGRR